MKKFLIQKQNNNLTLSKAKDYELIATCYHEAGHVVLGILNLIKTKTVTVNVSGNIGGSTLTLFHVPSRHTTNDVKNILLASRLYMLFAGTVAESIYYKDICGAELPPHLKIGAKFDLMMINKIISKFKLASPGKPRKKLKLVLKNKTNSLLKNHWFEVRSLAHLLYSKRTLIFEDIKKLLINIPGRKAYWQTHLIAVEELFPGGK